MSVQPTVNGVFVNWSILKIIVDANSLMVQYIEDNKKYNIWAFNGPSLIRTTIYKSGIAVGGLDTEQNDDDRYDFEENYKPHANQLDRMAIRVENDVEIKANVDSIQTGNLFDKTLRCVALTSNQSISNSAFTTVYTYNGSGIFSGAFMESNWSNMQLEFIVDDEKVIDGIYLEDIPICGSGNSGHGPLAPLLGRLSSEEISIHPSLGIRYESSITIKLKSSNSGKKLISGYVVLSKET